MTTYTALLDANVLYPAPMRDILLQLSVMDVYRAKWTAEIHDEWMTALLKKEPHRSRTSLERTRHLMDSNTRDCLVTGYAHLIPSLTLPDEDDRHVLAAAIIGRCDAIVTQNLRDFPVATLAPLGMEAQHPDEFLCNQFSLSQGTFCTAIRKVRLRLKHPPYSIEDYLAQLTSQGLVATVAELEPFAELL